MCQNREEDILKRSALYRESVFDLECANDRPIAIRTTEEDLRSLSRFIGIENHYGVLFSNEFLTVFQDRVIGTDGVEFPYLRLRTGIHQPAGVAILPVTADSEIVLIEHFRHATGAWHWEIPRGFCSSNSPIDSAKKELEEEIGVYGAKLTFLGRTHTNTGLMSEVVELFMANVETLSFKSNDLYEGSMIRSIRRFPVSEVTNLILDGGITDSFTVQAVFYARLAQLV